jgi:hypothetical protein
VEDWQQWQIRADQIAAGLGAEVEALRTEFFGDGADSSFRTFWPRFRDLKERVRTAPAIRLEDKLDLERRLRDLGSRAYKAQEVAYAGSAERKAELQERIQTLRAAAESEDSPRALRTLRRELDGVREQFDAGALLVPADRQAVWDAWRETNQFVWQRLTGIWEMNETYLRDILANARRQIETGNTNAARQAVGRFFEALRSHEARQNAMNEMKAEAESLRQEAEKTEERRAAERLASQQAQYVPPIEAWRAELERNRELAGRLGGEISALEQEIRESGSILEQAMIRGDLVEKRRRLSEVERTNRTLEQRIDQAEDTSMISAG